MSILNKTSKFETSRHKIKSLMREYLYCDLISTNLSKQEIGIVMYIYREMKNDKLITASSIAQEMNVTIAAIMHKLSRIEELGYLKREEDTNDKRIKYLRLEEGFLEKCELLNQYHEAMIENYFAYLGKDDEAALFRIMEKTICYLEEKNDKTIKEF